MQYNNLRETIDCGLGHSVQVCKICCIKTEDKALSLMGRWHFVLRLGMVLHVGAPWKHKNHRGII